ALPKEEPNQITGRMQLAQQALERLADNLPALKDRQEQAKRELDRLRQQQNEIARQTNEAFEQAKRDAATDPQKAQDELNRKLGEAAKKQAENAEALSKLDVPRQEARREQTEKALNKALADLLDRKNPDARDSQEQAKKQLEQLQQALDGK